jgi:hypothetical protein
MKKKKFRRNERQVRIGAQNWMPRRALKIVVEETQIEEDLQREGETMIGVGAMVGQAESERMIGAGVGVETELIRRRSRRRKIRNVVSTRKRNVKRRRRSQAAVRKTISLGRVGMTSVQ